MKSQTENKTQNNAMTVRMKRVLGNIKGKSTPESVSIGIKARGNNVHLIKSFIRKFQYTHQKSEELIP